MTASARSGRNGTRPGGWGLGQADPPKDITIRDRIAYRSRWARTNLIRAWYRGLGYAFDRRHGIETSAVVVEEDLDGTGPNAAHATRYEPSPPGSVRRLVRASGIEPPCYTFVDLGSGKGKAVIDALRLGFLCVVGVEFSPTLHGASVDAVQRFAEQAQIDADVQLLQMDAAAYPIPSGNLFVYLYHPFEEPVMKEVVEHLEQAARDEPGREIVVGYLISNWSRHFEASPVFEQVATGRHAGFTYHVFRSLRGRA